MMGLRGECFRHQNGRMTQRITLGEKSYFIKQHSGVGWKEIVKNVLQLRWPVLSAKNEWRAIQKLQSLGISVPTVIACGQRGYHPARLQSFVLLEELAPVISLEELCLNWRTNKPAFSFKHNMIKEMARIARILHQNGINHRDFYICHFLLDTSDRAKSSNKIRLFLIDLHRAQIRRLTPMRWIIKDLAGLYFSSKEIGLTQRDLYRFMQYYSQKSLRDIMDSKHGFWLKVKERGEKLYCDLKSSS